MAEAGEPAAEDAVDALGADDLLLGPWQVGRVRATKGWLWVPPSPPWEPTSSSNAATSLEVLGQKVLLTTRSGQCGNPSVRRTWSAAFGPNGASGSSPSTVPSSRKLTPPRADRHRPAALGAHEDEADPRVVAERRQEPRVERLDLLERDPARAPRGKLISPRQPEAITESSGTSAAVRSSIVLADIGVERDGAVGDASAGRRPHRPPAPSCRRARPRSGRRSGSRARRRPPLGRRRSCCRRRRRARDQILERLAVAVAGRSRPATGRGRRGRRAGRAGWRRRGRGPILRDLAIEVAEDRERVVALDPGVVGDLVVGEEGRVDDGPAGEEVADHGRHLEVALDDGRPGARPGRSYAAAAIRGRTSSRTWLRGRPALAGDVGDRRARACGRPRRGARSRRSSRARSAGAGSAPCSSSASSAARRRRGCWRGWRRPRAAGRARRNGAARALRRRGGGW